MTNLAIKSFPRSYIVLNNPDRLFGWWCPEFDEGIVISGMVFKPVNLVGLNDSDLTPGKGLTAIRRTNRRLTVEHDENVMRTNMVMPGARITRMIDDAVRLNLI